MLFRFDTFPGFALEDFLAFEERKWSSNRFNLERMKTRAKMEALGRELVQRHPDATQGLEFQTTQDHPHIFNRNKVRYMWGFLDRPEEERAQLARMVDRDLSLKVKVEDSVPQDHVALVGVGIDREAVCGFFRLHANALLDKRNLAARLADPAEQQHLAVLLSRLPEGIELLIREEPVPLPTTADGVESLRRRLEDYSGYLTLHRRWLADELPAAPALLDDLTDLLPRLLAVWRFCAWTRDNDRLKLAKTIKEEKKQKARRLTGLEEGDRVRVLSGLLSGKEGTVVAVDHKGRAKIQLGRMHIDMDPKLLKKIA